MFVTEIFSNENRIFTNVFKTVFPTEYKEIFGETDSEILDSVVNLKYGGRTVISSITPDNAKQVVQTVITLNVANWVQAAKTMMLQYDVLNPVRNTVKTQTNGTEKQTSNDSNTTSVKAFNDDDFSPDNKNDSDTNKDVTTENIQVQTVSGFNSGDVQDKLKKDFQFRLDNWRESIIFALIKEITLSVY